MASKSYFFSIAEAAAEQFVNEKTINIYKDLDFQDTKAGIRLNNLFLKITTHRIIFSNDPQIDKINPKSQSIFFKLMLKDIVKLEKKMKGLIHQKIDSFIIHIQNQQVEVFGKGLENPFLLLEGAIQKKEWAVEKTDQDQAKSEIYLGLKQEIKSNIMDAEKTKENVKSSFTNFDTFFKNFHELSEATKKLRQNQAQNQNDEVNKILESMGCIQVITKDEAGDKYYEELGKQIFKFCTELFPKQGGIVLLMDIYYYFNKKRQLSLLSPDEVLKACEQFKRLNLPANLTQYQGIKVVESTQFDIVKDFDNTIGKLVSTQVGLTAEQISKKLGYSLMVTKIKLKRALENGLLCEDRRVEWTKYYRNIFLS